MNPNYELSFNMLNYNGLIAYLLQPVQQDKDTFHNGKMWFQSGFAITTNGVALVCPIDSKYH